MADRADFVVRLIERVRGPARAGANALHKLTAAARTAQRAVVGATATNLKYDRSVNRLRDSQGRFLRDGFRKPAFNPIKDLARYNVVAGNTLGKLQSRYSKFTKTPIGYVLRQTAMGAGLLAHKAFDAAKNIAKISIAVGGISAIVITKMALEMGFLAERSKKAFGFIFRGAKHGVNAWNANRVLARDYGLELKAVNDGMLQLTKQGFTFSGAQDIVKITADMQATGATAEQVQRAVLAITQVKSKGFLYAEELRQQLAETGISVDGVIRKVAELKKISIQKARDLVGSGKVEADLGIEAIKGSVLEQLGIEKAGDAAFAFSKTLPGLWAQLKAAPQQFFAGVADKMITGGDSIRRAITKVLNLIDEIDQGKVAGFVDKMSAGIERGTDVLTSFIRGAGTGLDGVFDGMFGKSDVRKGLAAAESGAERFAGGIDAAMKSSSILRGVAKLTFGDAGKGARKAAMLVRGFDDAVQRSEDGRIETIGEKFGQFLRAVPKMIGVAKDAVVGFTEGLFGTDLTSKFNTDLNTIDWDALGKTIGEGARSWGTTIRLEVLDFMKKVNDGGMAQAVRDVGFNIGKGLVLGIADALLEIPGMIDAALNDAGKRLRVGAQLKLAGVAEDFFGSDSSIASHLRGKAAAGGADVKVGASTIRDQLDSRKGELSDRRLKIAQATNLFKQAQQVADAGDIATARQLEGAAKMLGKNVGFEFETGIREQTDTHSPSRAMKKVGQDLMAGLSMGISPQTPKIVLPSVDMAGYSTPSVRRTGGRFEHVIHVRGDGKENEALAQQIADKVLRRFVEDIEQSEGI